MNVFVAWLIGEQIGSLQKEEKNDHRPFVGTIKWNESKEISTW